MNSVARLREERVRPFGRGGRAAELHILNRKTRARVLPASAGVHPGARRRAVAVGVAAAGLHGPIHARRRDLAVEWRIREKTRSAGLHAVVPDVNSIRAVRARSVGVAALATPDRSGDGVTIIIPLAARIDKVRAMLRALVGVRVGVAAIHIVGDRVGRRAHRTRPRRGLVSLGVTVRVGVVVGSALASCRAAARAALARRAAYAARREARRVTLLARIAAPRARRSVADALTTRIAVLP